MPLATIPRVDDDPSRIHEEPLVNELWIDIWPQIGECIEHIHTMLCARVLKRQLGRLKLTN